MPARTLAELFVLAAARIHLLGVQSDRRTKKASEWVSGKRLTSTGRSASVSPWCRGMSPCSSSGASKIRAQQIRRCSSSEHHPMGPRSSEEQLHSSVMTSMAVDAA